MQNKIPHIVIILLLIAQFVFAQKQFVLDTVVDASEYAMSCGKCLARCVRADSSKIGHISIKLMPPKWDSALVELYPEYSYYALKNGAYVAPSEKGEVVHIEPPKYVVKTEKKRIGTDNCNAVLVERPNKSGCLYMDASLCLHICVVEIPSEYPRYQTYTLVEFAKIVRQRGKTQIIEALDSTSPLLTKVVVPPQYFMKKTHNIWKQRYRIEADFDFTSLLSEWREIQCCGYKYVGPEIADIQRALRRRGYRVKVDGILGKKTKMAITRFQQKKHFPVGNFNGETYRALGFDPTQFFD